MTSESTALRVNRETLQEINHKDRAHAAFGGSAAERLIHCTGSYFLTKDLPPQPAGERAIKGTRAHELGEKALRSFLQKKLTGEGIPGVVEEIMACDDDEIVDGVIRYCDLVWTHVLEEFVTDKAYGIEEMFVLHEVMDMWGTTDFWVVYHDSSGKAVLAIVDFKFGYHEVSIDGAQLPFYACSVREFLLQNGKDIDYARCIVIQPPLGDEIDNESGLPRDYKEKRYTAKQLDSWKKKFLKAGHQIFVEGKAKFKTGSWCRWCKGQSRCKKYTEELEQESSMSLLKIEDMELPEVENIPDETLVKIISHKKKLESFLKAVSKYVISRHVEGKPLPGLKAVAGVSKRRWLTDKHTVAENLRELGLGDEQIFVRKVAGLGKVESALREKLGCTKGKASELIDSITEKPPGAISIVPVEDKRPAISSFGSLLLDETTNEETENED